MAENSFSSSVRWLQRTQQTRQSPSLLCDGGSAAPDNGGNTSTNVGPGVDGKDAVNVDQLTTKVAAATTEVEAGTNVADVETSTGDKGQTI